MTPQQQAILHWLQSHPGPHGPTEIARNVASKNSAWSCPKLYKLVEAGLVVAVRHPDGGHYYSAKEPEPEEERL
jgi:Fe2+ or Zn2+ uptake regulation protein